MNPLILMGLIVVVPTVIIALTRAKASLVFMSLCVGSLLSVFVGDAAMDMMQLFMANYSDTTQTTVQLILLIAPVALTILFLSRTVSGSKWVINIFPALLTGITGLFLVVPLLTDGTQGAIYGTEAWDQLTQYQALLISAAALSSLFQLWASGRSARHKRSRRGKK